MRAARAVSLAVMLAPILVGAATDFTQGHSADGRPAAQDTTGCLDTLRASDSVSAVVKMSVGPQDRKAKLPADFEGLFVQEFRSRLNVPKNLPLGVMVGWKPCDSVSHRCAGGVLMFGSHGYFIAHPTGTLSRIGVVDLSLTPAFSDSVRAVLERISQEKMSPFLNSKDSIPLKISIGVEQHSDTVPTVRHLFRVTIPRYNLPFTYAAYPKDAKPPKYPSIAERRGVGDSVGVTFTVLHDGSVAPQSVDVQAGTYRDFMQSVFDRLATTRYVPANVGGCRVATWVRQNFVFNMR
jgi:TonB family protein